MPFTPGSHRIRSRSFGPWEHSTERLESVERPGHNHQHWQGRHIPSVGSGTGLATGLVRHHRRLVGQGTGLETAG
jgi:hypothetical protein